MELNNREWAMLSWLAVVFILVMSISRVRSEIPTIARQAAHPKILVPFTVMTVYVAALVLVGWLAAVWNPLMLKGTVVWFVGSGLALFVNLEKVWSEPGFFRRKALSLLAPTVFVEYFINLFVFSLLVELILQPFLAMLVALQLVVDKNPRQLRLRKFFKFLLGLATAVLFLLAAVKFIRLWDQHDVGTLVLDFALPVVLTVVTLPFIYAMAVYSRYEPAFVQVDSTIADSRSRWRVKLALLTTMPGRIRHANAFGIYWATKAGAARSFAETRKVIKQFLASKREEEIVLKERQDRLVRYAGIVGTDSAGRQQDRREFKETIDALRWLASSQRNWHDRKGKYRDDPIQLFEPGFRNKGLPYEHGITLHVAENGQAWWAWRRTITGWCFAIGAAGPPPDEWEFDGPAPPDGFPGQDHRWGDEPFSLDFNSNWLHG